MITTKSEIKEYIDADLNFVRQRNLLVLWLKGSEFYPIVKLITCLRHYEYYYNKAQVTKLSLIELLKKHWWRFFYRRTQLKYSLYIGVNVAGKGLHLMHPGFRYIMEHTLGENCTVLPMVLVGKKCPGIQATAIIGNNVYLGNGSTVLAPVSIGDNAVVGAGAVVTHDIPADGVYGGGTFEKFEKPMKIMFINYGLAMGGAEVIAANYLSKMKEKGQDVCLLELMHRPTFLYKKLVEEHIPIYSVLHNGDNLLYKVINKFFGRKISLGKIPRIIDDIKPDVIHLQMYSELLDLDDFGLNRVFLTIHSDLNRYLRPLSKYGKEKLQSMMQKGMHVIVLCERAKKDVLKFCPSADVHVIPNGLDIDYIKSQKYDRNQLCRELGISADAFILGHVGRFHKVKNHDKLIDVFACLHEKKPNSVLVLVGDGTAKERAHLKKVVAQKRLNDCVKFLGIRSDATAIMSCFDSFALPSFQESFSLVLVEAQAHHVRCLASDTVPEEVICNDNCFALSINDSSDKWASLLLDTSVRKEGVKSIYDFDINKVLADTNALYNNVL